jgi:hypothetical protein
VYPGLVLLARCSLSDTNIGFLGITAGLLPANLNRIVITIIARKTIKPRFLSTNLIKNIDTIIEPANIKIRGIEQSTNLATRAKRKSGSDIAGGECIIPDANLTPRVLLMPNASLTPSE